VTPLGGACCPLGWCVCVSHGGRGEKEKVTVYFILVDLGMGVAQLVYLAMECDCCKDNHNSLGEQCSLKIWPGEIQSKYICKERTSIQYLPSQGKSEENIQGNPG
jgi:hypothetical protein